MNKIDVSNLLEQPLDTDNLATLADQLVERAAWQSRVSLAQRDAETLLDTKKAQAWGNGKTDMEKRINMEAVIAGLQGDADYLKDLADILKTHILLGQSLLKSMGTEMRLG